MNFLKGFLKKYKVIILLLLLFIIFIIINHDSVEGFINSPSSSSFSYEVHSFQDEINHPNSIRIIRSEDGSILPWDSSNVLPYMTYIDTPAEWETALAEGTIPTIAITDSDMSWTPPSVDQTWDIYDPGTETYIKHVFTVDEVTLINNWISVNGNLYNRITNNPLIIAIPYEMVHRCRF